MLVVSRSGRRDGILLGHYYLGWTDSRGMSLVRSWQCRDWLCGGVAVSWPLCF